MRPEGRTPHYGQKFVPMGRFEFTKMGLELSRIAGAEPLTDFWVKVAPLNDAQLTFDNSIEAFSEWSYAFRLYHLLKMCGRKNDISSVERRWAKGCILPEGGWARTQLRIDEVFETAQQ